MIWFFWIFTALVVVYTAYVASVVDTRSSNYLATTRTLRCFVLWLIYWINGLLALFNPDQFDIAKNTGTRTWLEALMILSVLMTLFWLLLFIDYRRKEAEHQETVSTLKQLKWREAVFDRKAFAQEWRTLLTQSKDLFFRRKT